MTDRPFAVNGADFSDCVAWPGYETDRVPVYAAQYTDLSGYDHDVILRDRGKLHVPLCDLAYARSTALRQALLTRPLRITYRSFQLGRTVTEEMRLNSMAARMLLEDTDGAWLSGDTLEFTQL